MGTNNQPPEDTAQGSQDVTFLTILRSVFSSFIGVQSNANRKRDFESGKFWHFFAAGVVFVLVLLGSIWLLVQYLVAASGQ